MTKNEKFEIDPTFRTVFNYADKTDTIRLEDWLGLLTLCLAPLLAHIIAGVPTIVRRSRKSPLWLDQLCLYNPTTILWRYLAIVDRRVRRKSWNAADMAASNAYFWTDDGWDGSEEMMVRSRVFCVRTPSHNQTELLSTDSFKTIIATLQGVQAITVLVRGVLATNGIGNQAFNAVIAMDKIFYPLASFGVLRLFAALWLTEEYSFLECRAETGLPEVPSSSYLQSSYSLPAGEEECYSLTTKPAMPSGISSTTHLIEGYHEQPPGEISRPVSDWRAVVVRVSYLTVLSLLLVICAFLIAGPVQGPRVIPDAPSTGTLLLLGAIYIVLSMVSIATISFYLFRCRNSMTTVLPCLTSWWYRAYTILLLAASITMLVLSGIYTRRTPCGKYTLMTSYFDNEVCNGVQVEAGAPNGAFAFAAHQLIRSVDPDTGSFSLEPSVLLFPLDGWCSGTLTDNPTRVQ